MAILRGGCGCDAESVFHPFYANKEDRDLFKFFWWHDGDFVIRPVEYRLQVHVFRAGSSDDYTCRQNDFNTYVSLTSKATLHRTVFRVDMKNTSA